MIKSGKIPATNSQINERLKEIIELIPAELMQRVIENSAVVFKIVLQPEEDHLKNKYMQIIKL